VIIPASNRLLKLLRFFGVPDTSSLSADEAWKERAALLADPIKKARWDKYVYLTQDVDSKASDLKPFDPGAIDMVTLPQDWSATRVEREYREEMAAMLLECGTGLAQVLL
jgi:hypothetical protein